MESVSSSSEQLNSNGTNSNVELTLLGIDKKWVRSNGSWMDKTKVQKPQTPVVNDLNSFELTTSPSHWWQFWKA